MDESRVGRFVVAVVVTTLLATAVASAAPPGISAPSPVGSITVAYPQQAHGDAVVELELLLGEDGTVVQSEVKQGALPFAEVARSAAEHFRFTPATKNGIPVRARVALRNEERDFACVLVAERFAVASGMIPAVLTKETDDAFQERMTLVQRLSESLDGLYAAFLRERLGSLWKEAWEPTIVTWADGEAIPAELLSLLLTGKQSRTKKAKAR